jgi:sirohydrochlorin ferrochelatase
MNTPLKDNSIAVLLIAHGSRRQAANEDLVQLAEMVRERGEYSCVEICYLELAEPDIPQGIAKCVEQGANRVLMLPYFLSAGSHVVDDLEGFRNEAVEQFPSVHFELCPPLGLHPLMVDLVMTRLAEGGERSGVDSTPK